MKAATAVRLGEFLSPIRRPVKIVPTGVYRSLGVKWYAKGLFIKESVSGSEIKATRLFRVEPGDFLYNRLFAWKGSFAVAGPEHAGCFVSGEFPTFRADERKMLTPYLLAFFSSSGVWDLISQQSSGTARVSRSRFKEEDLLSMVVPLPPIPEQERIVRLLDAAEELRRLRAAADRRTADLVPALFHEMFGDPASNPKGWPVKPLGELVELISGGTPSKEEPRYWGGSIPWISPKDMKDEEVFDAEDRVTQAALDETSLKLIPRDSVLIVVRGMILAHTLPVRINRVEVAINQDMKAIRPVDCLLPGFLRWAIQAQHGLLLSKVSTASHGTKKLDVERLTEIPIPVPPLPFQRRFVKYVAEVRALEAKQAESRRRLDDLFDSLLHRAFRDEV